MDSGSPDDECDSEIMEIKSQLVHCHSGKDIAHAISKVLNSSFTKRHKPEHFEEDGNIIFMALVDNGLK